MACAPARSGAKERAIARDQKFTGSKVRPSSSPMKFAMKRRSWPDCSPIYTFGPAPVTRGARVFDSTDHEHPLRSPVRRGARSGGGGILHLGAVSGLCAEAGERGIPTRSGPRGAPRLAAALTDEHAQRTLLPWLYGTARDLPSRRRDARRRPVPIVGGRRSTRRPGQPPVRARPDPWSALRGAPAARPGGACPRRLGGPDTRPGGEGPGISPVAFAFGSMRARRRLQASLEEARQRLRRPT